MQLQKKKRWNLLQKMQRRDFATVKKPSKDFATAKIIKCSNKKAGKYF